MNRLGADGWDYVRADALPCDERVGLTGTKTTFQNMLVFRRVDRGRRRRGATTAPARCCASRMVWRSIRKPAPPRPACCALADAEPPSGAAPALGPAKPDLAAE